MPDTIDSLLGPEQTVDDLLGPEPKASPSILPPVSSPDFDPGRYNLMGGAMGMPLTYSENPTARQHNPFAPNITLPRPSTETVVRSVAGNPDIDKYAMVPDGRFFGPSIPEAVIPAVVKSKPAQVITGGVSGLEGLAEGFTSDVGIASLGMGGLPALAQRAVALAFAGQMASQVPELARQLGTEFGKPENERDYKKISELITQGVTTTGFSAMSAAHGLKPQATPATEAARMLQDNVKRAQLAPPIDRPGSPIREGPVTLPQPEAPPPLEVSSLSGGQAIPPNLGRQWTPGPAGTKFARPVTVPGTPAPLRRLTVTEEIGQHEADTTAKVQALFPHMNLTREQAAALRRAAYGEAPPTPPRPGEPPPEPEAPPPEAAPARTPLYRGTTVDQWQAIQRGETPQSEFSSHGLTWATTDRESAEGYSRREGKDKAVLIEYKDSAHDKVGKITDDVGDKRRQGKLGIEDVAKVYDGEGNVIYDAENKGDPNADIAAVMKERNKLVRAGAAQDDPRVVRLDKRAQALIDRNRAQANAEINKQIERDYNASSQQETAAVHGDVQPQPREGEGEVPVEEGGGGIQPQTGGGLRAPAEGEEGEVSLTEAPKPTTSANQTGLVERNYLSVPVPDATEALESARVARRQVEDLRKQMGEVEKKRKELEPKVVTQRGPKWQRGRVKASAKKADVAEWNNLAQEHRRLYEQANAIEGASTKDRQMEEVVMLSKLVNDSTRMSGCSG